MQSLPLSRALCTEENFQGIGVKFVSFLHEFDSHTAVWPVVVIFRFNVRYRPNTSAS
jgi:hypothetical protein